jgi:superfamily I DNA and/or RNA helicase
VRASSKEIAGALDDFDLVGGTSWFFSRPDVAAAFDLLVVDEAGQVSLANLVAVAGAAKNLVLVGDQMQLAQPLQGTHPGESGRSGLEYLLEGRATIADDLGVFLGVTRRLHPSICSFISGAVYEDRLRAIAGTERRVVRVPDAGARLVRAEAGVVFVPVEHEGNAQASEEEAEAVRAVVDELLGRERIGARGEVVGEIGVGDILCVAPYNLQVRTLKKRLPEGVRVGSVDLFQGQEAPIVIVSMGAGDAETSARGLEFLFDRRRINVAVSRAQSLAIVVGHPGLARSRCASLEQLALVNTFCRLVATL